MFCSYLLFLILQNAISEYFFGMNLSKYNFIAVNYLVTPMKLLKYHGVLSSSSFVFRTFIIAGIVTYFVLKGSRSYIDSILLLLKKLKYRDYISFCLDCL
jgi:hypothetical protein